MSETWIFPLPYVYFRDVAKKGLFKPNHKISWIVNITNRQISKLLNIGDEVYFWWSDPYYDIPKSGIFGYSRVIKKPVQFSRNQKEQDCIICPDRIKNKFYHDDFKVDLKIEIISGETELISNSDLEKDSILFDLEKTLHDGRTYYLIPENQNERLKVIFKNTNKMQGEQNYYSRNEMGQGLLGDSEEKDIIEFHAVEKAIAHYTKLGFVVTDTGKTKPYDLSCVKDAIERRVEVKGSKNPGNSIKLTRGEVEHVWKKETNVDLFIVSEIVIQSELDGPKASGGKTRILSDWMPLKEDLTVINYEYKIPPV